jgi:DNA-binding NarL/FixJ family response regulator
MMGGLGMRIVMAEDSSILRDGMVQLLRLRGHEVVAAVADGEALITAIAEHRPDLAVVDIRMPPTFTNEGVLAATTLRRTYPRLGILLFSQYVETTFARQLLAMSSARMGYLLKDRVADLDEFVDALERIAAGGTALDPEVVSQLLRVSRHSDSLATLTPRERQVLEQMAEGHSNAGISASLRISSRAVEKHVAGIFTKLDLPPSDSTHRRVLAVLKYLQA